VAPPTRTLPHKGGGGRGKGGGQASKSRKCQLQIEANSGPAADLRASPAAWPKSTALAKVSGGGRRRSSRRSALPSGSAISERSLSAPSGSISAKAAIGVRQEPSSVARQPRSAPTASPVGA